MNVNHGKCLYLRIISNHIFSDSLEISFSLAAATL